MKETINFLCHHYIFSGKDCEVGEWEEWSTCDNPCGYGTRKRKRDVTQYPDNGGSNCPDLKQRRACVGYQAEVCRQNLAEEQIEEKSGEFFSRSPLDLSFITLPLLFFDKSLATPF